MASGGEGRRTGASGCGGGRRGHGAGDVAGLVLLAGLAGAPMTWAQEPVPQPDADGRVVTGRRGTHHWQPYMADADLGDYHHAPPSAVEAFRDQKYGLRIHWGLYSIEHGRESWILAEHAGSLAYQGKYHDLHKAWDPRDFDADAWTDMMAEGGFRFFVFTAKHHDGFSMYDTATRVGRCPVFFGPDAGGFRECDVAYSIMETPLARDVTGELVEAGRAHGLRIGLYFSHPDWYDGDFRFDEWGPLRDPTYTPERDPAAWARFRARHRAQLMELVTRYGPLDMLSLDMWLPAFAWPHMKETIRAIRQRAPEVMLRWRGIGHFGDYQTPENYVPGGEGQGTMPWQVIHALSTRNIFSYEPDERFLRDGPWIVDTLVDIVAKGGNFMVGIGPDLTGRFHPAALEAIRYAGDWLRVSGEAIYATRPCATDRQGEHLRFTCSKDGRLLYAIATAWPGTRLVIRNVRVEPGSEVRMLGVSSPLHWSALEDGLAIEVPERLQAEENRPCRQAWAFRIEEGQVQR
jgi:alpha-L-fucosidase